MKIALIAAAFSASTVFAFAPVSSRKARHSAFQIQSSNFLTFSGRTSLSSASVTSSQVASAVADINENASRDLASFDEWATNCGVQRAEGFQLTSDEDGLDWSIMTTQPHEEGVGVLSVPNSMILTSSRARQEFEELGIDVHAAVDLLGRLGASDQIPQFYLFVKILAEYEKGDQSSWFPWLNSLPRLYYNAVSMTNFCYECLPPLVFSLSRIERVKCDNFYDALQKVDFLTKETTSNKDLAKWAFNAVYTRCWGPDDDKQIIPMVDMINHGTETEVATYYDDDGNCIVYTTKEVPAGSPLRMSYGDPTNPSHFFATYGFLDETSPATFSKIMLNPTAQLLDLGYDYSRMLFYKDTGDISEEVWDVMLYQTLGASKEIEAQQAFYEAHMSGDAENKQSIHQHYFLQTAIALQTHVDTFVTRLDELSEKGVGKDLIEHPRLPLILRHNEFVKSTFLTVKARLDSMVAEAAGH
mmetsp:Transcript_8487/g.11188  ORF Transcript_8487/g.11188 Transcript_8487/m.11188 type:complete len:471 (+) Transcript_8487:213-1625(+)|eukprot:CAMPEP_0198147388 /NCGR_PEP_ID=MMETSP1443-20131203/35285_1 /TAXON_ID=186043 /ORGANISM="Entomoneis sp., Strain CCMP2396" /LENGTH=470 /DNA_ID=CAMNT_0043811699 /DNA_START=193 /DNA_END=1605 /DNA_ORIENTATION=+